MTATVSIAIDTQTDALVARLENQARGETRDYDGIEVHRQEARDPDGWEFAVGKTDQLTALEAADLIGRRL